MRLLLLLSVLDLILAQNAILDYGARAGDQVLVFSTDQRAVALDVPIVFMESPQNELFISSNGILGIGSQLPDTVLPLQKLNRSAVAVYYAPIVSGNVYYRATSSNRQLLDQLTQRIHQLFADSTDFKCLQAVIVTWENMQNKENDGGATFQLALASDGMTSYVQMFYRQLPWSSSGGIYAQSGLSHLEGKFQTNVNSGTPDVKELANLSNHPDGESFIFRVSGSSFEDPKENPDDYNYDDEAGKDYDGDERVGTDCPEDPYRNNCPDGCNVLTDDRGCSLCVCAESERDEDSDSTENNQLPEYDRKRAQEMSRSQEAAPAPQQRAREEPRQPPTDEQLQNAQSEDKDETASSTCAGAGENVCHAHGECREYPAGICCVCKPGFYGNGKECLAKDDPQRITGSLEGVINGVAVDRTDLHTYITPSDGNAYTAVSKIPTELASAFLLLNPIGSVMGWLFAEVRSHLVYNGFQLTGGLFNRTVTLHIGDRYYVTIKQQFSGRDIHHYFKANVFVSGTLPPIAGDAEVAFPDYEEEYRREGPGFVRSYSGMDVTVKENGQDRIFRMTVDQQIHYKECAFSPFERETTVSLHVKRLNVVYDNSEGIVRFGSRNYAHHPNAPKAGEEPMPGPHFDRKHHVQSHAITNPPFSINDVCAEGKHVCTQPNMKCRPFESNYRCECHVGYQATANPDSTIGWGCNDLDECDRGDHTCDQHASCTNTEGSFICQCNPGFAGDGHHCINENSATPAQHGVAVSRTGPAHQVVVPHAQTVADGCTSHQQCHQWGECVFVAGTPSGICKCRGWYVGDGVEHCGPPEEAARSAVHLNANVPKKGGKPCGRYVCDVNAECMPDRTGGSECVCRAGYQGNGVECESLTDEDDERDATSLQEGTVGKVCRSHDECHEQARCAYNRQLGYYQCACNEPYIGNGVECTKPDVAPYVPQSGPNIGTEQASCTTQTDCSTYADCIFERTHSGGRHRCVCQSGFSGDGKFCSRSEIGSVPLPPLEQPGCDSLRNCDRNAQCVFDAHNRNYRCECHDGFTGDGLRCTQTHGGQQNWEGPVTPRPESCNEQTDCHQNGHCVAKEQSNEYFCECLPGYKGDGVRSCLVADTCNPANPGACHQNAECVYGETEGAYTCKCVTGFTGDGVTCLPHAPASTCRENPRMCHANAQCVFNHERNAHICLCKPGSVGDGHTQCTVIDTPRCTNCSMHAHCVQTPTTGGFQCKCNAGYHGNGHICVSMTSCLDDRNLCDEHAECVPGEGGYYVCNCHYGYHGNGRTCTPDSEGRSETLLIARGMAIFQRGTHADVPGKQLIVIPHHIAVGIDFDCQDERIVWSDISGHSIRSASFNGTHQKSHFADDLNSPEGIAVDWSSRNVYYADSLNDEIGVASLNGKYKKALVTEGLVNPRSVALDIANKHLYYTDWHRENPYLGRVDMDGKNNRVFLNEDVHLPNYLTTLPNRKELCWVDAGNHRLSCIGFDGKNRRVVFAPLQYPFGLTHENEARFYWTDWKDNRIHTVGVYGDGYASFPISMGGSGKVYGIVSVPKKCVGAPTECSVKNGGCKYLCLPGQEGVQCTCPDNVAVKGC